MAECGGGTFFQGRGELCIVPLWACAPVSEMVHYSRYVLLTVMWGMLTESSPSLIHPWGVVLLSTLEFHGSNNDISISFCRELQ